MKIRKTHIQMEILMNWTSYLLNGDNLIQFLVSPLKGKLNAKVAPLPFTLFFAHILPLWASMILLEINNPNPVPLSDLVENFVNNLGNISRSMPLPLSDTYTTTQSSFLSTVTEITPFSVNLTALFRRLEIT